LILNQEILKNQADNLEIRKNCRILAL